MKKVFLYLIIIIVVALLIFILTNKKPTNNQTSTKVDNFLNASYEIDGQNFTLQNGTAEKQIAADSASKIVIKYFGNEVKGDFDANGKEDIAFLLTEDTGGSGVFYYIVAALDFDGSYQGTNAILLGDRIAPQTTEFSDGKIIVNYAERMPEEVMTDTPSVGVSRYFEIENSKLVALKN